MLIDCLTARDSCSRCDAGKRTGKIAYFEEHVSYEVVMLNYTFMRLMTLQPSTPEEQLDCNAFLESFGVHARNLVDFFLRSLAKKVETLLTMSATSRPRTKRG